MGIVGPSFFFLNLVLDQIKIITQLAKYFFCNLNDKQGLLIIIKPYSANSMKETLLALKLLFVLVGGTHTSKSL